VKFDEVVVGQDVLAAGPAEPAQVPQDGLGQCGRHGQGSRRNEAMFRIRMKIRR
jgi:hypothetical protein